MLNNCARCFKEFKEEEQHLHSECESLVNDGKILCAACSMSHAESIEERLQQVQYRWCHLQETILMRYMLFVSKEVV